MNSSKSLCINVLLVTLALLIFVGGPILVDLAIPAQERALKLARTAAQEVQREMAAHAQERYVRTVQPRPKVRPNYSLGFLNRKIMFWTYHFFINLAWDILFLAAFLIWAIATGNRGPFIKASV
jgi:hypothetical protein